MSAKDYLKRYLKIMGDIKIIEEELKDLNDMVTSITPQSEGERVQGSAPQDKIGNAVAKICDTTTILIRKRDEAIELRREIFDTIISVEHKEYKRILYLRYIQNLSWEEIAIDIHRNYRYTLKLHGRALKEIEKHENYKKTLKDTIKV